MRVYQVVKSYFDGDHDHGSYRSPLFLNRADAENFLSQVDAANNDANEDSCWYSDDGWDYYSPYIVEMHVEETAVIATKSDDYLTITYT